MGIIMLPPKRYRCSECGSENCTEYQEPPAHATAGHFEGVKCLQCGHKSRRYKKSIWEQEAGSGNYSISRNLNEPHEF